MILIRMPISWVVYLLCDVFPFLFLCCTISFSLALTFHTSSTVTSYKIAWFRCFFLLFQGNVYLYEWFVVTMRPCMRCIFIEISLFPRVFFEEQQKKKLTLKINKINDGNGPVNWSIAGINQPLYEWTKNCCTDVAANHSLHYYPPSDNDETNDHATDVLEEDSPCQSPLVCSCLRQHIRR